jgi:tetratricopeptide (TPR) repeat protein
MAMGYYYYYCEKEYGLALQHFSSVLVDQPNNSDAIEAIAYIQRRFGKWEESLESLRRAAELDPRSIRKVIEMQLGALALRQYDLAREYFELGCRISPDAKDLYERESWRYIMAYGDTRRARQTIEEGQRLTGPGPMAEELELLDILDRDFESALQRRPTSDASLPFDDFDYYLFKGYIYFHLGDSSASLSYFDSARVKYEGITAEVPDFPVPHSRFAVALAGVGRFEEALRECSTALSILSRTEDALFYPVVLTDAAHVYVLSRNYDRAIETLDSILSVPFIFSVETLKLDPFYDPLRDLPLYQALVEKYEKRHEI